MNRPITSLLCGILCVCLLAGCATHDTATNTSGRFRLTTSLKQNTPYGKYDLAIVEAVTKKWYDILASQKFAKDRTGTVVLRFRLHPDGTVTDLVSLKCNVGEVLNYVCIESVKAAAPFAPWPPDMEKLINAHYREITFEFYYY